MVLQKTSGKASSVSNNKLGRIASLPGYHRFGPIRAALYKRLPRAWRAGHEANKTIREAPADSHLAGYGFTVLFQRRVRVAELSLFAAALFAPVDPMCTAMLTTSGVFAHGVVNTARATSIGQVHRQLAEKSPPAVQEYIRHSIFNKLTPF